MLKNIENDKILILDFGSQYAQLIARRVRELGVYCELVPFDVDVEFIKEFAPKGIILSGGPESTTAKGSPRAPQIVFDLDVPLLGICYGMQTMAMQLGGSVKGADKSEFGYAEVEFTESAGLFNNLQQLKVWMSHGDQVESLPEDFLVAAKTDTCPYAAMMHKNKPYYGLQFHPEVTHTEGGEELLAAFLHDVCACGNSWTPKNIIDESIEEIRAKVGDEQVLLALSGGVDSSVVAALLHQAIGDQLTCIFVDTGLLRLNEGDQVMQIFAENLGVKVIRVNAQEEYYAALKGEDDPETKRKIIGNLFIDIFERESAKLNGVKWLAQGTIYPDVIESAGSKTGKAHVIKSHHNVGGLPEDMTLELIEPLRMLFKDEVRRLGVALGLPEKMVYRHPFPGPGLAVRILGEVKPEYVGILQQADNIFIESLHEAGFYETTSQAFAVFLPVKAVGVKGDARCYEYVIALRSVNTIDFMTAHFSPLPHEFLSRVAERIMNEVKHVARVTYDISSKPPATIEWE